MSAFCPRHGRADRPVLTPGLRCDCQEVLDHAVGALRRGKWVSAATMCEVRWTPSAEMLPACGARLTPYQLADGTWTVPNHPRDGDEDGRRAIEDRANQAVAEALRAGYELGLRSGVPPAHVHGCMECGKLYVSEKPAGLCGPCWAERNP